jgi:hypothetical protein
MVVHTGFVIENINQYYYACFGPLVTLTKPPNHSSNAISATDVYHPKGLFKGNHKITLLYNVQH